MKIQVEILTAVPNSRTMTSGELKGQTLHSVTLYAHNGDMVPSAFQVSNMSSEADAKAFAAKFPQGSKVMVNVVPRQAMYVNQGDIQSVTK